jgi:hypothetical protein
VVLAVALAVVGQGHRLAADVVTHVARRRRRLVDVGGVLVDVVADVHEERRVVLEDALVRREVAVLELRAARQAEAQLRRRAPEGGGGPCAPGRARLAVGVEAVPVLAIGAQAVDLDVDRVPVLGARHGPAAANPAPHALVERHVPADGHRLGGQRALAEGVECKPRPQDDAVSGGLAGRNADGERVAAQARALRERRGARDRAAERERGRAGTPGAQEGTARNAVGHEIPPEDPLDWTPWILRQHTTGRVPIR